MVKPQICLVCVVTTILLITVVPAYSVKESQSGFGLLVIDNDLFSIKEDQYSILQVTGNAVNSTSGVRVVLVVDKPDGSTMELKTIPNNVGEFSTSLILDTNWEKGDYSIHAFYNDNQIGTVNFSISDVQAPTIIMSSNIGSINVEDEKYTVTTNSTAIIKIYGKIIDYDKNEQILFSLKKPDGSSESFAANGKKTGEYVTHLTAKDDWQAGKYYVMATYKGNDLGQVSFTLDKVSLETQNDQMTQIPKWIKTSAGWWAANQISDSEFVSGIQYLIKEKILIMPSTAQDSTGSDSQQIPSWLRKNAGWWNQGFISDEEFIKSLQYLIQKNIIKISDVQMRISSDAFENNRFIPSEYTCDGADISPQLSFSDMPKDAKSLALIMDDPDAPVGTFVHWVVWNMSPEKTSVAKGEKIDAIQGKTDFGKLGYGGPCPPSGTHRYFFKLYALDEILGLTEGSTKQELEKSMKDHIIEEAHLIGKYSRK